MQLACSTTSASYQTHVLPNTESQKTWSKRNIKKLRDALSQCPVDWLLVAEGSFRAKKDDVYSDIDVGIVIAKNNFRPTVKRIYLALCQEFSDAFVYLARSEPKFPNFAICLVAFPQRPYNLLDVSIRAKIDGGRGTSKIIGNAQFGRPRVWPKTSSPRKYPQQVDAWIEALIGLLMIKKCVCRYGGGKKVKDKARIVLRSSYYRTIAPRNRRMLQKYIQRDDWQSFFLFAMAQLKKNVPRIRTAHWLQLRDNIISEIQQPTYPKPAPSNGGAAPLENPKSRL